MPRIFTVLTLLASPVCGEEVIRSPSELTTACQENRNDIPFEIDGVVVIPPTVPRGLFTLLSGDEMITLVDMRDSRGHASGSCQMGDHVVVRGRTEPYSSKHTTTANCHALRIAKSGILPDIASMSVRDFLSGRPVPKQLIPARCAFCKTQRPRNTHTLRPLFINSGLG